MKAQRQSPGLAQRHSKPPSENCRELVRLLRQRTDERRGYNCCAAAVGRVGVIRAVWRYLGTSVPVNLPVRFNEQRRNRGWKPTWLVAWLFNLGIESWLICFTTKTSWKRSDQSGKVWLIASAHQEWATKKRKTIGTSVSLMARNHC
jgi:hypothetical protein